MRNYKSLSDQELVADCLDGDDQAWAELITRYKRLIYFIPAKYRLSPDDSADIFQTVCTILMENLSFLRDQSKISAWLVTTTARECWKVLRERRREVAYVAGQAENARGSEPVDPAPLPEQLLGDLEAQHMVRRGVQLLDERCRRLVSYLFYARAVVSYKEIGKALQIPPSSIGPTRARCLSKLKKILAKQGWR